MLIEIKDFAIRSMMLTVVIAVLCIIFFGAIGLVSDNTFSGFQLGFMVGFTIGIGLSIIALIDNITETGAICGVYKLNKNKIESMF